MAELKEEERQRTKSANDVGDWEGLHRER